MSKPPLKRLYFDTNILRSWPNIPNNVASIFGVANWVGTELFFPKTVEDELEAQFVRAVNQEWDAMSSSYRRLGKLCKHIIDIELEATRPNSAHLREAFNTRSKQLKDHWKIQNIPLREFDLAMLVEMAINREAPFEEVRISDSKHVVTGLQDTAILVAIIAHMKSANEDDRCAFATNDGIFHTKDVRDSLATANTKLELLRTADAVFDDLFSHVWAVNRAGWETEMKQVEQSLNQHNQAIKEQMIPRLNISKLGASAYKTTIELKEFEITEFTNVKTELPPSEHLPPAIPSYKRPEGSKVQVSARAYAKIVALTENWGVFGMISNILGGGATAQTETPGNLETSSFGETLNVSIDGIVNNGLVGDFKVTSVDINR